MKDLIIKNQIVRYKETSIETRSNSVRYFIQEKTYIPHNYVAGHEKNCLHPQAKKTKYGEK